MWDFGGAWTRGFGECCRVVLRLVVGRGGRGLLTRQSALIAMSDIRGSGHGDGG